MKFKLMIQSLSPLALLITIRNFPINQLNIKDAFCWLCFFRQNGIIMFVVAVCFIWIVLSIFYFISFLAFKWSDKKSGYTISNVSEKEDASLNFFLTIIIPLLIDDVSSAQGAICFFVTLVFICILLYKTNLFYENPILGLLGYCVYEFSFTENKDFNKNKKLIGLCIGEISTDAVVEYKKITDNVLYIKEMKK